MGMMTSLGDGGTRTASGCSPSIRAPSTPPWLQEALDAVGGDQEEARRGLAAIHPVGRMGQPADIANAVLFLASDWGSFMTGESVCVDGGIMAKGAWT